MRNNNYVVCAFSNCERSIAWHIYMYLILQLIAIMEICTGLSGIQTHLDMLHCLLTTPLPPHTPSKSWPEVGL